MRFVITTASVLTLIVLFSAPVSAQLQLGIRGGASYGVLYSPLETEIDGPRAGAGAGVILDVPVAGGFFVRPEAGLFMGGGRAANERGEIELNFVMIEVPLLARYRHRFGSRYMAAVYGGPLAALRVNSTVEWRGHQYAALGRDFAYGLATGADIGVLRIGSYHGMPDRELTFGVRYSRILTDLVDTDQNFPVWSRLPRFDLRAQWVSASITMHL